MKKLTAIIGICMMACMTQAQTANSLGSTPAITTADQSQSVKSHKQFDPQKILAKIEEAITKRTAQEQKATANGKTDIAAAIQKIIMDLNNMKTAIDNKDRASFKTGNQQRKQDRQALKALRKANKAKNAKTSGSTATAASNTKPQ